MAEQAPESFEQRVLREWGATRGPLFEDAQAAVCRVIALGVVAGICVSDESREVRLRAGRIYDEALSFHRDSNRPATRRAFAQASRLFVDVSRARRQAGDPTQALADLLYAESKPRQAVEVMRLRVWAELLAAAMTDHRSEVRLRAARTLLARTRDDARKVGAPVEDGEALEEVPEETPELEAPPPGMTGDDFTDAPAWDCRERGPP